MQRHIISTSASLLDALNRLNDLSGGVMTLFAVDHDGKMLGTLTDGDVRRALISGIALDAPVNQAMHRQFTSLSGASSDLATLRSARDRGIRLLPVLDSQGCIIRIVDLSDTSTILPLSAILMAGGIGERLRPLTLNTPKPLLEIGGKAIIDYNIEALARCGITDITVTTRYLASQIHDHFSRKVAGVNVHCVEEPLPLGTIGAASLAHIPDDGYSIVMNADLLTSISFEDMYIHHLESHSDITIAAIPYQVAVPYAILSIDPADPMRVTGLEEKPLYSYFANAGIYIFPNSLLKSIPDNQRTDATDLIDSAIQSGLKVTFFPINGTWIDIGTPTDFRQACELMRHAHGLGENL